MSKGGKAPSHTTSTVTQTNLPEYAEPYYKDIMSRASLESSRPYTPFPGQRLAGFTGDQGMAFTGFRDLASAGLPSLGTAAGFAQQGANQAFGASNYTPLMVGTDTWSPAAAAQYMNPYTDQVMNRLQDRAYQRYREGQLGRDAAAHQSGAYGGSRHSIMDFLAEREMNQQLADIEAQQLAAAYQSGLGAFGTDQARMLQAGTANQQALAQALGLQLEGARTGIGAAGTLADIGQADQRTALERLNALLQSGGIQQEFGQRQQDIGYEDFINQRDYERGQLNWLASIMHGVPTSAQSEVIQYQPGPNQLSQMLGLGLGGVSLGKLLGGGGG